MKYLDKKILDKINENSFLNRKPYPWIEIPMPIKSEMIPVLLENLPDISLFKKDYGRKRKYGQKSHDRYELEFKEEVKIPTPWREFIHELESQYYKNFLKRIFNKRNLEIRYHWHLSTRGDSISPHCDGLKKVGSHIFYLNSKKDWKESWGGQTLVLFDNKNKDYRSNPEIKDFYKVVKSKPMDNSFIFMRTNNSWHAVEELKCPEDKFRKVFIVVIDRKVSLIEKKFELVKNIFSKFFK